MSTHTPQFEQPTALARVENALAIVTLAGIILLPLWEIFGRQLVGRGIAGSIPIVQHLTLWITILGAVLASRSDRHLALWTKTLLPQQLRGATKIFTSAVAAGITACLLLASADLVRIERGAGSTIAWEVPVWVALLIMPIGFSVITGRLIWHASKHPRGRLLASLGLAIPAIFGLIPAVKEIDLVLPAVLLILVATALGMPIFTALGGTALVLFWGDGTPANSVPGETYRLTSEEMLPAIPLFTVGGYILAEGGASQRLMRLFTATFGWMPGGLAIVVTLLLAFFTPLTGASGITILSMGGLLLPVLLKARYPEPTSVGLVTVSGSIGLLFAPSLPVILYGVKSGQPIEQLFIGGLLPGVLLVLVVAAWAAHRGWLNGATQTPFCLREALAAVWISKWDLFMPVVVLGGIFGGFVTLVEASALTVLYALVIECIVHRGLHVTQDLPQVFIESITLVGGFMIILGMAFGFTSFLIVTQVPTLAVEWVQTQIESPLLFLLALNILLIIVGAVMDIYSAIIILVPLIHPMGIAYGINPIHLGIIFLANMELGYLMPPMGENLFLSSLRFKQSLTRVYRSTFPYVLILLVAVFLITYVPSITLTLVEWFAR